MVEAGAHALAAEAAHAEELTALAVASALAHRRHRRSHRPDRRRRIACRSAPPRAAGAARTSPTSPASRSKAAAIRSSRRRCPTSGERFVANDLSLGSDDRLWLITGPNMGGKSTFLRQAALVAVLAQSGSFVPATRATVGIVDRLFSRVGASDNLARGRSTFMVEMVETARSSPRRPRKASSSSTRSGAAPRPMTGSPSPGRWSRRCTTRCSAAPCSRPIITS